MFGIVEKRGSSPVALCLVSGKNLLGLLEEVCLVRTNSCWGQLMISAVLSSSLYTYMLCCTLFVAYLYLMRLTKSHR